MKEKSSCCMVCVNSALLGLDELKVHILTHHVRSVFLCDLCQRIYYQKDDINEHVASAHLQSSQTDFHAVKLESVNQLGLSNDGAIDFDDSAFDAQHSSCAPLCAHVCDLCNYAFPLPSDLKAHILSKHSAQSLADDDDTNNVQNYSDRHTPEIDSNGLAIPDAANSPVTSTNVRSKSRKSRPKKIHIRDKRSALHECDVCGKQFVREYWLNKHKLSQHSSSNSKTKVQGIVTKSVCEANGLADTGNCSAANITAGNSLLENSRNVREEDAGDSMVDLAGNPLMDHARNPSVDDAGDSAPEDCNDNPSGNVPEADAGNSVMEDAGNPSVDYLEDSAPEDCNDNSSMDSLPDPDWTPDNGDYTDLNDVIDVKLENSGDPCTSDDDVTTQRKVRKQFGKYRARAKSTPFQCLICGRYSASANRLKIHMVIHRSDDNLRCYECGKTFKRKYRLQVHMDYHLQLQCQFCDFKGHDFTSLEEHIKQHKSQGPEYTCERCGEAFYLKQMLQRHMLSHERRQTVQCTICGKAVSKSFFKRHMMHHTGDTFNCSQCSKKFYENSSLRKHMLSHTGETPFTCEICGKSYHQEGSLKHHLQHKHSNLPKEFKCDLCPKAFYTKNSLKAHMTSHSDVRPFTCDECGKSFKTVHQLHGHMMIHSSVKPFKCDLCPYAAQHQTLLRSHQKQHATAKNFKCPHCESAFVCQRYLNSHIRAIHRLAGVRPHACEQCGKAFRTRDRLKRHLLSHSTEQPYRCTMCGRSYKHRENLKEHHQKSGHQNASTE